VKFYFVDLREVILAKSTLIVLKDSSLGSSERTRIGEVGISIFEFLYKKRNILGNIFT
jgi:hypothetical protein